MMLLDFQAHTIVYECEEKLCDQPKLIMKFRSNLGCKPMMKWYGQKTHLLEWVLFQSLRLFTITQMIMCGEAEGRDLGSRQN